MFTVSAETVIWKQLVPTWSSRTSLPCCSHHAARWETMSLYRLCSRGHCSPASPSTLETDSISFAHQSFTAASAGSGGRGSLSMLLQGALLKVIPMWRKPETVAETEPLWENLVTAVMWRWQWWGWWWWWQWQWQWCDDGGGSYNGGDDEDGDGGDDGGDMAVTVRWRWQGPRRWQWCWWWWQW